MNLGANNETSIKDHIKNLSPEDLLSLEIRWSLFSAAVTGYRADTLVRPFPPQFIQETGEKDLDSLVRQDKIIKVKKTILYLYGVVHCFIEIATIMVHFLHLFIITLYSSY